ncbi:electron transport complex subunit RsxC [Tahibacter soli]|uniref:Ion-translocating oxidoreductase complex subunit C n=1 Tax=Tahibacter soli TaxID=2983605 RepID=A0A9X4BIR8_9GAMM|nr:electron transport complex subunit RsxC [Tahibacter soli]MDC8015555.1 electron transport complex subunit RsxC [Tahibacter soli]
MALSRFHGGLRLPPQKPAAAAAVVPCPLPPELVLPLAQHAGLAAEPCVVPGQVVLRGDTVARAAAGLSAPVHASSSGVVRAIESRPLAGGDGPCIVIEPDGRDTWNRLPPLAWRDAEPAALRERVREAGIVGLGGAAFPSPAKLAASVATLIVNGAECEPHIACDEGLMRERAGDVLHGAALLARIVGAGRVVVAIEERMLEARAALATALRESGLEPIEIVPVPTIYPEGGERQLIRVLTGREVPAGGLPRDIGVLCHNVATAYAAWRAVAHGEALTSRIVSVTGAGVRAPRNVETRLGTPIGFLVGAAGGYTGDAARLVVGGPMMGAALPHDAVPIVKGANAVLVLGADDIRAQAPELPCIRCGECSRVCPAQLMPQELYAAIRAGDDTEVRALSLDACIECGCCAYVCPSQIPLVDAYRQAKRAFAEQRADRARADHARERFHARTARLEREAAERVERVAARREALAQEQAAKAAAEAAPEPEPPKTMGKSDVLAAIARAKAKKAAQGKPPEGDTE